ncbi:MAG: hypothetical protein MSG64_02820 [Pyrinomonadaceae bacterium MAG19_C2-C3]|nr:hypothetical protein [Pyrinomonadaceae bacterium MAG19_C2-C3]
MKRIFFDVESLPPEAASPFNVALNPAIVRRLCHDKRKQRESSSTESADTVSPHARICDEEWRELALHAEYGRVLCIGIIIETDGTPSRYGVLGFDSESASLHTNERRTLRQFWKLLENFNPPRDLIIVGVTQLK